jgi:DNA replication protein DnaC
VKGTEKCLRACKALAAGKTDWKMLLIYGGVGNGKTHLLEALALELYSSGTFCRVFTFDKMMRYLRSCIGDKQGPSTDEVLDLWCRGQRLIIDDVGVGGSDTAWSMKMLEEIILARYRDNLFTVLSTNADISELPERVISRFTDPDKARMVNNTAEDYRPKKGKK